MRGVVAICGWWLAGATAFAPIAVGLVLAADAVLRRYSLPLLSVALVDEAAHVCTALLFLFAIRPRLARALAPGTLLGTVLIDADHLPMLLGSDALTPSAGRPYTHSLSLGLAVLAVASRRAGVQRVIALGLALGVGAHLVRDMATGGVPLFWPLSARAVELPYGLYAWLLLCCLALAALRASRRRGGERRRA